MKRERKYDGIRDALGECVKNGTSIRRAAREFGIPYISALRITRALGIEPPRAAAAREMRREQEPTAESARKRIELKSAPAESATEDFAIDMGDTEKMFQSLSDFFAALARLAK